MNSFSSKSPNIGLPSALRIKPTSQRKLDVLLHRWIGYCALAISISLGSAQSQSSAQQVDINEIAKTQAKNLSLAFQNASSKAMKSVVTVLAKRADVDSTLDELDLLDTNSARNFNIGSGVIINESGLCVTNNHVIKDSKGIRVRLGDGRELTWWKRSNSHTEFVAR